MSDQDVHFPSFPKSHHSVLSRALRGVKAASVYFMPEEMEAQRPVTLCPEACHHVRAGDRCLLWSEEDQWAVFPQQPLWAQHSAADRLPHRSVLLFCQLLGALPAPLVRGNGTAGPAQTLSLLRNAFTPPMFIATWREHRSACLSPMGL